MIHLSSLQTILQQKLHEHFSFNGDIDVIPIGGGSINQTYRISSSNHTIFCKVNSATKFPQLFKKESKGLGLLKDQHIIKVPGVIDCFEASGLQVLLLEWIESGERTPGYWKSFGRQLAALHQVEHNVFGLNEDNYMGSVVQTNQPSENWVSFFTVRRLEPMIRVSIEKKLLSAKHRQQFENLYKHLPNIFGPQQRPALVHGDLWSGNHMCGRGSVPVLIDPAVYYGHPSVDLGMTTLFGGFHSTFYEAYHYHSPFPLNYEEQWEICNLYPLLIHLILFGKTYLPQVEQTLQKF